MKFRTYFTTALAIAVAAGLVMIYSSSFAGKARVATLSNVKGTVTIKSAGAADWIPAVDRMEVKEEDELKTEAGSSAIIKMDDGSMIKLGPLAKMKMAKLGQTNNNNNTSIDVSIGKSWNRVRKLTADSDFSVKTPTAVAGVRGTFFSAEVEKTDNSTFGVYDGSISVSGLVDPNTSVTVDAHNQTSVAPNARPSAPSRMSSSDEQNGRAGFSDEEYAAATFDLQIGINPQVVDAGKTATLSLQVFKNGQPFRQEVKVNLSLSGAATFVSTGTNEIEASTDSNGALSLEITSPEKGAVTATAQMQIKIEKK